MSSEKGTYDIYGYAFEVEGQANRVFKRYYGWASKDTEDVDLRVVPKSTETVFPTKPAGSKKGLYVPFNTGENKLSYEDGVPLDVLLSFCEGLMTWPTKTLLHAGAVAKDGEALLFIGTGNVGKTSIVLNLLRQGYEYLSDDWLVVGDGYAFPFPKPIRIFDYNLRDNEISKAIFGPKIFLYRPIFWISRQLRQRAPHRFVRYAFQALKPTFPTDVQRINPEARIAAVSPITKVFLIERQDVSNISVRKDISKAKVVRRMAFVKQFEWSFFYREYCKYVSEFDAYNENIERSLARDIQIYSDTFRDAELNSMIVPRALDLTRTSILELLKG